MEESWLVFSGISPNILETLEKRNVPYWDVTITKPVEGKYRAFPPDKLPDILSALGFDPVVNVAMTPTNIKEVVFVKVTKKTSRDSYLEVFTKKYRDEITRKKERAKEAEKQVEELQSQLLAALRELDEIQAQIKEIDNRSIDRITEEEAGKEFDKLASFQNVARVDVEAGWLVVETHDITHKDDGRLGTFKIRIQLTSETTIEKSGDVSWVPTVRIAPIKEYKKHPHAGFSSSPDGYCLGGDAASFIAGAIRKYEFAVALDIIFRYLEEG